MPAVLPPSPAETYERYFVPAMFRPWSAILLRHAGPRPGERVLDLACGTGVVARAVAAAVGLEGRVTGLDVSAPMLAVARALPPVDGAPIAWEEGDAAAPPFPDAAFELVTCQHGLQFLPDRARAVAGMRRVLAPGGRAAVIVLQPLARHPVFAALLDALARRLGLPLAACSVPFVLGDQHALRALFHGAGFASVRIEPESIAARFADPERFVPLAVMSMAAAIPAFAQLGSPERSALIEAVRGEVDAVVAGFRDDAAVAFPVHGWVVLAGG